MKHPIKPRKKIKRGVKMKIDFDQEFSNPRTGEKFEVYDDKVEVQNGQPVVMERKKSVLTLRRAAIDSLLGSFKDEDNLKGEEKIKRHKIAMKIAPGGRQTLTLDEVAKVKELINKNYGGSLVYPQAVEMFEEAGESVENGDGDEDVELV